jgi:hypothetical protein
LFGDRQEASGLLIGDPSGRTAVHAMANTGDILVTEGAQIRVYRVGMHSEGTRNIHSVHLGTVQDDAFRSSLLPRRQIILLKRRIKLPDFRRAWLSNCQRPSHCWTSVTHLVQQY